MNKLIKLSRHDNGTLLYIFNYLMIGVIHQSVENKVKGIVLGIWRFQFQVSIGYSDVLEEIGDAGIA
jgi:hypothetical protein